MTTIATVHLLNEAQATSVATQHMARQTMGANAIVTGRASTQQLRLVTLNWPVASPQTVRALLMHYETFGNHTPFRFTINDSLGDTIDAVNYTAPSAEVDSSGWGTATLQVQEVIA